MKKLVLIISSLLVLSTNITNLQAKEWYEEKGTLHQSTMKEWCKASDKNKLATAGDFVSKGYIDKLFKPEIIQAIQENKMDGIKFMAGEIVTALDTAACEGKKATKAMSTTKVNDLVGMSMLLMNWVGKE